MLRDFCESEAEYDAFIATLTTTHERKIGVRVMNLNHKTIAWLEGDAIVDGQVTIDATNRECSRVATLRLADPSQSIGMEPDSASTLPVHLRRMVQVVYHVRVPGFRWVGCPIFTGQVKDFDRTGADVSIAANSKEGLALGNFGHGHSWKKGRKKIEVIREILELGGETTSRMHLPPLKATLKKPFNVRRGDRPWVKARKLARDMGWELFYDGRGHVRMRKLRGTPVKPFIGSKWLYTPVTEDRPVIEFINGWVVLGDNPKGPKPRIVSDLIGLPENHDFSAQSLARSGEPFWKILEVERPHVKSKKRANAIARRLRDDHIEANAAVSFECLPLPNIQEGDLLRVIDPLTGGRKVRVKQATIPLVGGAMTIGAVRKVSDGGSGGHGYHPAGQGGLKT